MENASKALLIAGAILLVIAIIAIAVGIVSSTRGTIGQAELQVDAIEVQMHNKQFEQYEGKQKTHKEVKELLSTIVSNNANANTATFKVDFAYGYYNDNTGNGTLNQSKAYMVTVRDYKYTDNDMSDDIKNYEKWILNEQYINDQYGCVPVYDVQLVYNRVENGNNNMNGMVKKVVIYAWHK
ncbi:MAG: hypothetical protein E7311_07215 [Clostridiales bacterium]|nr:hypothetical protein [Clostridiales bacterium]